MTRKVPGSGVLVGVVLGCGLLVAAGHAQDNRASPSAVAVDSSTQQPCFPSRPGESCPPSLDGLVRLSRCELERLYRQAQPGAIAEGYARGRAIRWPGTVCTVPMSKATGLLWHGKIFHNAEGTLVNQWCCGIRAITARVDYGPSWLDGKPSIIMDYSPTSRVWVDVRDEIREVAPGLFLGIMYRRKCPEPKFVQYFALETRPCCGP